MLANEKKMFLNQIKVCIEQYNIVRWC